VRYDGQALIKPLRLEDIQQTTSKLAGS